MKLAADIVIAIFQLIGNLIAGFFGALSIMILITGLLVTINYQQFTKVEVLVAMSLVVGSIIALILLYIGAMISDAIDRLSQ